MKKSGKFLIALVAIIFSGMCFAVASPAKATADTNELLEESTDLSEPDVDPEDGIDPAGAIVKPTCKI
jgi:hypothetical protein